MPNRIIKESVCTSDTVDALSWFEECFWYRLIVNCDDYGRFDARPAILKSRLFPLKGNITEKSISAALSSLATVGLVTLYEFEGKPYLQLTTWEKHQQIRAKKSKYPAFDKTCKQLISDDCKCPRNPIQSESYSESESNTLLPGAKAPDSNAIIFMPLNDKSMYGVVQSDIDRWSELYPAVDVLQTLRAMVGWLEANPTRRKTKSGIERFINSWLAKEQNKGIVQHKPEQKKTNNIFLEMSEG